VFGEEAVVGKPIGDDLREGKPTPLLAITTERASAAQAPLLARVGAVDLTESEVVALQELIVSTGALAELEAEIKQLTEDAVVAIEKACITTEARDALIELAHYVAWRDK
jgi:geranylgeranyl diphosphate synthase type I